MVTRGIVDTLGKSVQVDIQVNLVLVVSLDIRGTLDRVAIVDTRDLVGSVVTMEIYTQPHQPIR